MSNIFCNTCQTVTNVSKCVGSLKVGTVSELNANVYVYLSDARGRVNRLEGTTNGSGLVTVDTSSFDFMNKMQYNIFVTSENAESISERLPITDNDTTEVADCLLFEVVTVKGAGGVISYPSQKLIFS